MEDFHEHLFRILGSGIGTMKQQNSRKRKINNTISLISRERACRAGKVAILSLAYDILKQDKRLKAIFSKYGYAAAINICGKGIIHATTRVDKSTQTINNISNVSLSLDNLKTDNKFGNTFGNSRPMSPLSSTSSSSSCMSCTSSSEGSDDNSDSNDFEQEDQDDEGEFDPQKVLSRPIKPSETIISGSDLEKSVPEPFPILPKPKGVLKRTASAAIESKPEVKSVSGSNGLQKVNPITKCNSDAGEIEWAFQLQPLAIDARFSKKVERLESIATKILTDEIPIDSLVFCQLVVFKHYYQTKNSGKSTSTDLMQRQRDVLTVEAILAPFKKANKKTVFKWFEKLAEMPRVASIKKSLKIVPINPNTQLVENNGPVVKRRK